MGKLTGGQCSATSKQSGERCKRRVKFGHRVCKMHGGASPGAIRKAKERILEASDDAVSAIIKIMEDPSTAPRDKLRAADSILDRAGIARKTMAENETRQITRFEHVLIEIDRDVFGAEGGDIIDAETVEPLELESPGQTPIVDKTRWLREMD